MCMYAYIYTYVYIYIHIYIYTHMHLVTMLERAGLPPISDTSKRKITINHDQSIDLAASRVQTNQVVDHI